MLLTGDLACSNSFFQKTKVATIHDIADMVRKSAVVNHPQLIGDYDGFNFVKFFDWNSDNQNYKLTSLSYAN